MKAPSLIKIKKNVIDEIKKRDPKATPKLTKVGLIDLMPQKDAAKIKNIAGFTADNATEFAGDPDLYEKIIKRMAIKWFRAQR
jgi:hypothetical protein